MRRITLARRRSPRRLAALTVVAVLGFAPLATGIRPAGAVAADVPPTADPIHVVINRISPIAPQPGDTLVVAGTLTNTTDAALSDINYALKIAPVATAYRSSFDTFADDQDGDFTSPYFVTVPETVTAAKLPTLDIGQSEHFRISVTLSPTIAAACGLGSTWGVHDMGVSVTSVNDTLVGHVHTFLPWAPRSTPGTRLGVAWILPITDQPHRTTSTDWFNDTLASELGPSGRLRGLVAAGTAAEDQTGVGRHPRTTGVPITWALDPMVVQEAHDMTSPYQVTAPSGTTTTGTGTPAAKMFMPALHTAVTKPDASVLALPFGDPDDVAAVRANLTSAIGLAMQSGRAVLQSVLGVNPTPSYGWPAGGYADSRTVTALASIGDSPLILTDAAVSPSVPPTYTPNAAISLVTSNGPVPTLLTDSGLTDDVVNGDSAGITNPDGSRLSLQRYLAETLMIQAEAPSKPRNVIVAPGRRWSPSGDYATNVLSDTGKVPWIAPTSLAAVAASKADSTITWRGPDYPATARDNELPQSYLSAVRSLRRRISDFGSILPQGDAEVRALTTAVSQALSAGWRGDHDDAASALGTLGNDVTDAMGQVKVATNPNSYITLTSHRGKVPVTIANNLDVPVRVMVRLSSFHRLDVPDNGKLTEELPANQLTRVDFRATANTSGVFRVRVQLLTPDGRHPYGAPTQLFVKSTVYGTITLVITGAATAALLIAVIVRLFRRGLAARRAAATPAS